MYEEEEEEDYERYGKNYYPNRPDMREQNRRSHANLNKYIDPQYRYNPGFHVPKRRVEHEQLDPEILLGLIHPDDMPKSRKDVRDILLESIDRGLNFDNANSRHDVHKFHPDFHSYLNSVNISTGYQGAGKTFMSLMEALGVVLYTPNTTHLIYIRKKNYDPTFEASKTWLELWGCHVLEIPYEEAESTVQDLFMAKNIYNIVRRVKVMREHHQEIPYDAEMWKLQDADVEGALEVLGLRDFNTYDWLNTIIIFDDVGNSGLFKNPDSYFNNRLKLCRDDNCIYFLNIHGITQLSPSIKANAAVVYVFKGLSKERLGVIYRQLNLPIDFAAFKGAY
jgi:hypothetical protein